MSQFLNQRANWMLGVVTVVMIVWVVGATIYHSGYCRPGDIPIIKAAKESGCQLRVRQRAEYRPNSRWNQFEVVECTQDLDTWDVNVTHVGKKQAIVVFTSRSGKVLNSRTCTVHLSLGQDDQWQADSISPDYH